MGECRGYDGRCWVQIPTLPFTDCAALGKTFGTSVPIFSVKR